MKESIVDTIAALVADAEAKGHEYMILSIDGRVRRAGQRCQERVRVVPGLLGRLLGERERAGLIDLTVDVSVADAKAWLARRGR